MSHYNTIMHQLLALMPRHKFESHVSDLDGNRYVKTFTTWNQLTVMLYAQAGAKDSLRDIENALAAQGGRLYHLGLPGKVARSTLADANANRDHRIYERLFYSLLERCKSITPKHKFRFKNPLYAFDSTVIDLCLTMFSWARFRTAKGAIKLHYQFDYSGNIPSFLTVTDGKQHDITVAKSSFPIIPDSIYCYDKAYIDFPWFRRINDDKAFFVTRAKDNMAYRITGQQEIPENKGILMDAVIELTGFYSKQDFPHPLRLVRYYDAETDRTFDFITNNFALSAYTIAQIYKARWQIEVFFKWIKHNLKIKTFLGTSKNAVLSQIWIAMCYYLLMAYIKYQTKYRHSIFYLHRIIQETLFNRISLVDLLNLNDSRLAKLKCQDQQLCLQF